MNLKICEKQATKNATHNNMQKQVKNFVCYIE